jgi:hypothetical protein
MNGIFNTNLEWVVQLVRGTEVKEYKRFHGHRLDNLDRAKFIARKNPGWDVQITNVNDRNDYYVCPAIHLYLLENDNAKTIQG